MEYMLLIYADERDWAALTDQQAAEVYAAYGRFTAELTSAGILRGGAELKPVTTATTVRVRGGKPQITDGPFAETREQLGGYYLIDVPDLDAAIKWAAKIPSAAHGSIEIRSLGQTAES
jgi:hypothetical protein